MSKSVTDYTCFAATVNSAQGISRQNTRLHAPKTLRLFLVCLFSFVFSSISLAQMAGPVTPNDWVEVDWGANPLRYHHFVNGGDLFLDPLRYGSTTVEVLGCIIGTMPDGSGIGRLGIKGNLTNLVAVDSDGAFGWIDMVDTLLVEGHLQNEFIICSTYNIYAHSVLNTKIILGTTPEYGTHMFGEAANRGSNIYVTTTLVNQGKDALIGGLGREGDDFAAAWSGQGFGSIMHVGGNLENLKGANIFGYKEIIVHGDFKNQGSTLIGGHWYIHNDNDVPFGTLPNNVEQQYQQGYIGIYGNV